MATARPTQTQTTGPGIQTPPADKPPAKTSGPRLLRTFAAKFNVDPDKLMKTLKDTAFKQPGKKEGDLWKPGPEVTDEQMMALLIVANEYHLNPFTREIYAFAGKGGGIIPIISVDGWIRIVNNRKELDGLEFNYAEDGSENPWVECIITRRDRSKPTVIREFLKECYRNTDPWNEMPRRMLRHKALVQCARVAFGYAGVYDPDEAERIRDAMAVEGEFREVKAKPVTVQPKPRTEATGPAPGQLFPDPMSEIRSLIDSTGVPETELLAHFELGELAEFKTQALQAQAIEWLKGVNRP